MLDIITEVAFPIREGLEIYGASYGYKKDLCGLCAIASFALKKVLQKHGIECKCIRGVQHFNHVWVEIDDKVIDLTATQFPAKKSCCLPDLNIIPDPIHIASKTDYPYILFKRTEVNSYEEFNDWWRDAPNEETVIKILNLVKHYNSIRHAL